MPKVPPHVGNTPTAPVKTDEPELETPAQPDRSPLEWALHWASEGWPVFPLRPGDKIPLFPNPHKGAKGEDGKPIKCDGRCGLVGHGVLDATRDPDKIRKWWTQNPSAGIGGATTERIVLDLDIQHGAERRKSLPTTREHLSGRGNGNTHMVYRVGGAVSAATAPGTNVLGAGIDIRATGGAYIVLPPSLHPETRGAYTIANSEPEHSLTDDEMAQIWADYGVGETATAKGARKGLSVVSGGSKSVGGGSGTGKLSELLQNPPERGDGMTNDWLTRVAGHYAKMHRDKPDLYDVQVRQAAALVDPDYEDTDKVLQSVWATEQGAHPERGESGGEKAGWLAGNGRMLLVLCNLGEGEQGMLPWANFDLEVAGVMVDADDRRSYQVRLSAQGKQIETTLDPQTVVDPRKLNAWLAQYGVAIQGNDRATVRQDKGVRLLAYLESQMAGEVHVVEHLGWDDTTRQFVTFDGAIRSSGAVDIRTAAVIADRSRLERSKVKQNYGFGGTAEEARAVLRQVQDFHFEDLTRPFGAWWAACLLKPQTMDLSSVFPYFAFEAASGSAKTNGYMGLMVQLNGNHLGQVLPTTASFRDSATTNHSGIVWADDLDNPERLQEILRAAASGGTVRKMGEDRKTQDAQIVNPLLFTGEALGLSGQKAMLERGFLFQVAGDVTKRVNGAGELQWSDIVALRKLYPGELGLTALAGWYVQEALAVQDQYTSALGELRKGSGRRGDKYAVLRAGARLFDHLVGAPGAWEGRGDSAVWVDAWVERQLSETAGVEEDNALTIRLLPWALQQWGFISPDGVIPTVQYRGSRDQAPPVLVKLADEGTMDENEVWVNTSRLAQAWEEAQSGRVDSRLETAEGLRAQITQIAETSRVQMNRRINGVQTNYRKLRVGYADLVIARSAG